MAIVPRPLLGRHVTAFTITGQAVAADGTLSNSGSPVSFYAVRRGNTYSADVERSEINGASSTRRNEVILSDGESVTLDVFSVNNGGDPLPLDTLYRNFDYFMVTQVVGTGSSQRTITGYYVRGSRSMQFEGRGESLGSIELGPCDPGQPQSSVTA